MANTFSTVSRRDGRNLIRGCGILAAVVTVLFVCGGVIWFANNWQPVIASAVQQVANYATPTATPRPPKNTTGSENITGATGGLTGLQRQTQLATVTPTPAPVLRGPGGITMTGIPAEVVTRKRHSEECYLPGGCNVISRQGVLGADDYEEAMANESAIWTGSAHHDIVDSVDMRDAILIPEAGYVTAYARTFNIEGGGMAIDFPDCAELEGVESCAMGVVIRGLWDDEGDRNVPVIFSDYGAPGALSFTRYPVPVHAGQWFSVDYLTAQAENALVFDNCGATGCAVFYQVVIDLNDSSVTILRYLGNGSWTLFWTNVMGYGSL